MTSRGWLSRAGAFGLLASGCVGGQSGTELSPAPSPCEVALRAVQPGDMTAIGTVEALAAEVEQAASVPMRIFVHEGEGPDLDTTLTLVASVARASGQVVGQVS